MKLIICLLFLVSSTGYSQDENSRILANLDTIAPSAQFDYLIGEARRISATNLKQARPLLEECLNLSYRLGDSLGITKSYYAIAFIDWKSNATNNAVTNGLKSLVTAKRNGFLADQAKATNLLGVLYQETGRLDEALIYNYQAMQLYTNLGEDYLEDVSIATGNVGIVYFKLGNFQEALKFYRLALQKRKEINSDFELYKLYINIGHILRSMEKIDQALIYHDSAWQACNGQCGPSTLIDLYLLRSFIYERKGDYQMAIESMEKGLKIAIDSNQKRFLIDAISRLLALNNDYNKPNDTAYVNRLVKLIPFNEASNFPQSIANTYRELVTHYHRIGATKDSIFYLKKRLEMQNKVFDDEIATKLAEFLPTQTEFELKNRLKKENNTASVQLFAIISLSCIIALLLVFIFLKQRGSL